MYKVFLALALFVVTAATQAQEKPVVSGSSVFKDVHFSIDNRRDQQTPPAEVAPEITFIINNTPRGARKEWIKAGPGQMLLTDDPEGLPDFVKHEFAPIMKWIKLDPKYLEAEQRAWATRSWVHFGGIGQRPFILLENIQKKADGTEVQTLVWAQAQRLREEYELLPTRKTKVFVNGMLKTTTWSIVDDYGVGERYEKEFGLKGYRLSMIGNFNEYVITSPASAK